MTSLDLGQDLVKLATRVAALNRVQNEYKVGNICEPHFLPSSFDIVVGESILHHLTVNGARMAIDEAYHAVKPGGRVLFLEPVENSPTFEFLQNLIPIRGYRPSIIQRKKWREFLARADDRSMSDQELQDAQGQFMRVRFRHIGLTVRLARLYKTLEKPLEEIDKVLTHPRSPFKRFAQNVIVTYYRA